MTEWPKQKDANAFFGNPDSNSDGVPDRKWEDANLVLFKPPYPMVLAWDTKASVKNIRCHRLVADSLESILSEIAEHYSADAIQSNGLHLYGGCYNFRLMKGGSSLSTHSWGSAIDIDPEHNAYGSQNMRMPHDVVNMFQARGWVWGGKWSKPDGMHFQAMRV